MDLSGRLSINNDELNNNNMNLNHYNMDNTQVNYNNNVQEYTMTAGRIDIESSSVSGSEASYYDAHDVGEVGRGTVAALSWGRKGSKKGHDDEDSDDLDDDKHHGGSRMGENSVSTYGDENVSIDHSLEKDVDEEGRHGRMGLFVTLAALARRLFRGRDTPEIAAEGEMEGDVSSVGSRKHDGADVVYGPAHAA